jgi:hypothetical protein
MPSTTRDVDDIRTGPARSVSAAAIVEVVATLFAVSDRLRQFVGEETPLGYQLDKAAERLIVDAYEERPQELWEAFLAAGREKASHLLAEIEAAGDV